jgi:hypothetical protein
MRTQLILMLFGLALPAAANATQAHRHESITLRVRPSYAICAGYCPDFTMTVSPSGQVFSRSRWTGVHSFTVGPDQLQSFHRILDPIRPQGDKPLDTSCDRARRADGKPDMLDDPRPDDVEIRWDGPTSHPRLASCARSPLSIYGTVKRAVEALGADFN